MALLTQDFDLGQLNGPTYTLMESSHPQSSLDCISGLKIMVLAAIVDLRAFHAHRELAGILPCDSRPQEALGMQCYHAIIACGVREPHL